jgi:hypothetical protein
MVGVEGPAASEKQSVAATLARLAFLKPTASSTLSPAIKTIAVSFLFMTHASTRAWPTLTMARQHLNVRFPPILDASHLACASLPPCIKSQEWNCMAALQAICLQLCKALVGSGDARSTGTRLLTGQIFSTMRVGSWRQAPTSLSTLSSSNSKRS